MPIWNSSEDDLVHLRARIDQCGSQECKAAAAFDVTCCAQEFLGRIERCRIDTTRKDATRCWLRQVVGTCKTRERIEQDDPHLALLDHALRALDDHFGNGDVILARHIERGGDHLATDRTLHIGDLFRALIDEQAHEVNFRIVRRDGSSDVFQDGGLAGLRRRNDEATLTLADR